MTDCKMSECQEYIPKPMASEPFIIFSLLQVLTKVEFAVECMKDAN